VIFEVYKWYLSKSENLGYDLLSKIKDEIDRLS